MIVNGYRIVKLGSVAASGARAILQYIYTGRYDITPENVIQLAKASKLLRMRKFEVKKGTLRFSRILFHILTYIFVANPKFNTFFNSIFLF